GYVWFFITFYGVDYYFLFDLDVVKVQEKVLVSCQALIDEQGTWRIILAVLGSFRSVGNRQRAVDKIWGCRWFIADRRLYARDLKNSLIVKADVTEH
ncbi:MAG: hypothetical protein MJA30_25570, partial [Cytophagales bacterium]|nr:hypothetical protein [Cytophagales bacterium]